MMNKTNTFSEKQKIIMNIYYSIFKLLVSELKILEKNSSEVYTSYAHLSDIFNKKEWHFNLNYPTSLNLSNLFTRFFEIAKDLNISIYCNDDKESNFKRTLTRFYIEIKDLEFTFGQLKLDDTYIEAKSIFY